MQKYLGGLNLRVFRCTVYVDTTRSIREGLGVLINLYILGVQGGVDVASSGEDRQVRGEKQVSAGFSHALLICSLASLTNER